jgi:hypothetical protein
MEGDGSERRKKVIRAQDSTLARQGHVISVGRKTDSPWEVECGSGKILMSKSSLFQPSTPIDAMPRLSPFSTIPHCMI